MANVTTINATVPVTTDGMGDGWSDHEAAAYAYAEWLREQIEQSLQGAYPDADITVSCPVLHQSGGGDVSVTVEREDGDTYPGDIAADVHSMSQDFWGRWCADNSLTSPYVAG